MTVMEYILCTYSINKQSWELQEKPDPSVLIELVVDAGRVLVVNVAGEESREGTSEEERNYTNHYLVPL